MSCVCGICGFRKDITTDFNQWPLIMGTSSEIYPVTKGGNPKNEVKGFICARCLGDALSIKTHIMSILSGVRITKHAVERFLSRHSGEQMDEETAKRAIIKFFF